LHLGGFAEIWRRGRDLNSGYRFCQYTPLAGERLRPLGHLSKAERFSALQARFIVCQALCCQAIPKLNKSFWRSTP
jgi:hypothetical protein